MSRATKEAIRVLINNRRFLDGIIDTQFPSLLTSEELESEFWHLEIDIVCEDEDGYFGIVKKGEVIFITLVDGDTFHFLLKEDYEKANGDARLISHVRYKNKHLHWNDILTG